MTILMTCSKCGWIGSTCYMGMQFDRQNRCPKCQPPSKMASVRKKSVDWEKERENNDQTNH